MPRQIKFRVWKDGKMTYSDEFVHFYEFFETLTDEENNCQQFTGLLDKNNKEIYEGDIVSQFISPHIANEDEFTKWVENGKPTIKIYRLVKYDGFIIRPFSESPTYPLEPKDIEVIGNIFENPELLK